MSNLLGYTNAGLIGRHLDGSLNILNANTQDIGRRDVDARLLESIPRTQSADAISAGINTSRTRDIELGSVKEGYIHPPQQYSVRNSTDGYLIIALVVIAILIVMNISMYLSQKRMEIMLELMNRYSRGTQ